MFAKGIAIGETNECSTVIDFMRASCWLGKVLSFGDKCEPGDKYAAIRRIVQTKEIGRPVMKRVGDISDGLRRVRVRASCAFCTWRPRKGSRQSYNDEDEYSPVTESSTHETTPLAGVGL